MEDKATIGGLIAGMVIAVLIILLLLCYIKRRLILDMLHVRAGKETENPYTKVKKQKKMPFSAEDVL